MDVVTVDWSGAKTRASRKIWLAHVRAGELIALGNGRTRDEVVNAVIDERDRSPDGLAVGLDFAFSFPAWFLKECGFSTVGDLWQAAADEGIGGWGTARPRSGEGRGPPVRSWPDIFDVARRTRSSVA